MVSIDLKEEIDMTNNINELNEKTVDKIISVLEDYNHHILTSEVAILMIEDVLVKRKEQQEGLLGDWQAFGF